MPRARGKPAGKPDIALVEEAETPQSTPRRSKRDLESANADISPRPKKLSKAQVNGTVKAAVTTTAIESTTIKPEPSTPRKRQRQPLATEEEGSPESIKKSTALKEKPKNIKAKIEQSVKVETITNSRRRKATGKKEASYDQDESDIENEKPRDAASVDDNVPKKTPRKRKTKEEKEAEAMPLAARSTGLRMYVGAHVSMAKGLENAITNSVRIGGNAFALFLKSQRKWENPPLKDENRDQFRAFAKEHGYDQSRFAIPHGSYLVNLAIEDGDRAKQAYDAFVDDLHRCEALGIKLYNFHPGAHSQSPLADGIRRISQQLNRALGATENVVAVLENAAGSGTVIGSRFSDLRDIIAGIDPALKSRVGVCIDTCHAFAAGYDLRTPKPFTSVLEDFDQTVGLKYLKALHLNDSKAPLGSKRDLHQNIGLGFLGLRAFHNVMNEPRFRDMPLILETPCDRIDPDDPAGKKVIEDKSIWAREIKLLESMIGMDADTDDFKELEKELSEKGRTEREKMMEAVEKKAKKAEKGQRSLMDMMGKMKKKKGKKLEDEEEEEDDD